MKRATKRNPAVMNLHLVVFAALCLAAQAFSEETGSPKFTERQLPSLRTAAAKPFPSSGPWYHEVYSLANLSLNQNLKEANDHILKNREENFPDNVLMAQDDHSFHWHAYLLERTYFLFSQKSPYFPGRLTPKAEKAIEEMLWTWVLPRYHPELIDPKNDWRISGSENHHLQRWGSQWGAYQILADVPQYQSRKLAGGHTVRQASEEFSDYFRRLFRNRLSRNCLFIECNTDYNSYSLGPIFNVADFAKDDNLKKLAHLFLDTYWTLWSIEQIDGVRGSSSHRLYQGANSFVSPGGGSELARFFFDAFANQSPPGLAPKQICAATSFYQPNPEIVELAQNPKARGCYEITARLAGLIEHQSSTAEPPQYVAGLPKDHPLNFESGVQNLLPDEGGITRYTWCTPDFIMGSSMVESRPYSDWAGFSSQNRWNRVIFAGTPTGRIFAQPPRPAKGSVYNTSWSVQNKGARIEQRLKGAKSTKGMRIWFDKTLAITEKDGWIFAEAPRAYAAVRILDGGYSWAKPDLIDTRGIKGYADQGKWAVFEKESSPYLMEVVRKNDFDSLGKFQAYILSNPVKRDGASVQYESSSYKTKLKLYADESRSPEIDGKAVNFKFPMTYESPFLNIPYKGKEISFRRLSGQSVRKTEIP